MSDGTTPSTLTILELYPEHLAINGDMGNVRVLARRLELAGHTVEHLVHNPGDELPAKPDFVTIGSGPGSPSPPSPTTWR